MLVHVVNNVLLLVPVVLAGQLAESFDRSVGTGGPVVLFPMAVCLAAAAISTWWGRRSGVVARAPRPSKVARRAVPPVAPTDAAVPPAA